MKFDRTNGRLDERLSVLSHYRRRLVLRYLREGANGTASVEELVRYVRARERDSGPSTATREEVEVELHHHHLPRLAEHGFVEYDTQTGQVQYCPDRTTERLLQFVRGL